MIDPLKNKLRQWGEHDFYINFHNRLRDVMRNWQISSSYGFGCCCCEEERSKTRQEDMKTKRNRQERTRLKENIFWSPSFLIFSSLRSFSFCLSRYIVSRWIFFRLPFLDIFLCVVYRIVTSCFLYFRFLFAWPLLVNSLLLLSLLLNILRHFFQTIASCVLQYMLQT